MASAENARQPERCGGTIPAHLRAAHCRADDSNSFARHRNEAFNESVCNERLKAVVEGTHEQVAAVAGPILWRVRILPRRAARAGAGRFSHTADQGDRPVSGRRRDRPDRADRRTKARRGARPADRGSEPGRGRRRDCDRHGRQDRTRRLHAALSLGDRDRARGRHRKAPLRLAQGPGAGLPDDAVRTGDGDIADAAAQGFEGVHRADEGQPREIQLCVLRRRHRGSSRGRAVPGKSGRRHGPCPLPRHGSRDAGSDRRTHRHDDRRRPDPDAEHPRRDHTGACSDDKHPLARPSRCSDDEGSGARLRSPVLDRALRADRHAEGHREQARFCRRQSDERRGRGQAAGRCRYRNRSARHPPSSTRRRGDSSRSTRRSSARTRRSWADSSSKPKGNYKGLPVASRHIGRRTMSRHPHVPARSWSDSFTRTHRGRSAWSLSRCVPSRSRSPWSSSLTLLSPAMRLGIMCVSPRCRRHMHRSSNGRPSPCSRRHPSGTRVACEPKRRARSTHTQAHCQIGRRRRRKVRTHEAHSPRWFRVTRRRTAFRNPSSIA